MNRWCCARVTTKGQAIRLLATGGRSWARFPAYIASSVQRIRATASQSGHRGMPIPMLGWIASCCPPKLGPRTMRARSFLASSSGPLRYLLPAQAAPRLAAGRPLNGVRESLRDPECRCKLPGKHGSQNEVPQVFPTHDNGDNPQEVLDIKRQPFTSEFKCEAALHRIVVTTSHRKRSRWRLPRNLTIFVGTASPGELRLFVCNSTQRNRAWA